MDIFELQLRRMAHRSWITLDIARHRVERAITVARAGQADADKHIAEAQMPRCGSTATLAHRAQSLNVRGLRVAGQDRRHAYGTIHAIALIVMAREVRSSSVRGRSRVLGAKDSDEENV